MISHKYLFAYVLLVACSAVTALPAQEPSTHSLLENELPTTSLSHHSERETPWPMVNDLQQTKSTLTRRYNRHNRKFPIAVVFVPIIVGVACVGAAVCCATVGGRNKRGQEQQQQQQQQQTQRGNTGNAAYINATSNNGVGARDQVRAPSRPPRLVLRDVNGVTVVEMVGQGQGQTQERETAPPPYSCLSPPAYRIN